MPTTGRNSPDASARPVVVFGPTPLLTVTIESRGAGQPRTGSDSDEVHVHAGGQGVWVSRMAAELGARPTLCGLLGGETGALLEPLVEELVAELRAVRMAGPSGCYVTDRREGERRLIAASHPEPATRHEVDELFSTTTAAALDSAVLVVCNPYPGDILPLEVYGNLVADARGNGVPVIVDLSTPRLDGALAGRPDLAKLNDWELAELVQGPVDTLARRRGAAERLLERGAGAVLVTRGAEPALFLREGEALELVPPRFERGSREGCGDSMMGGIAAAIARGAGWEEALVLGAAAGAANFLRHGIGTATRSAVEEVAERVELRPLAL